jgi:hypothetical protein
MKMTLVQFIPIGFFQKCEVVWPGNWLREATWGFAIIETIHIMVLAVLLGTIFVVDLRLLGLGLTRRSADALESDLDGSDGAHWHSAIHVRGDETSG